MAVQKALILPENKGQWVVTSEWPVPAPGPDEVFVKVVAAALNPVDWKIQTYGTSSTYGGTTQGFPRSSGYDGAGIIEAVGSEVKNRAKGDRIVFQGWRDPARSTFQQYVAVPAELTAIIPEKISFEEAASIPSGLITVIVGLYYPAPNQAKPTGLIPPWEVGGDTKYAGKPALVIGGSSSVGQYAIQVAKYSGFSPIIATASPHNEPLLRSLGATHVVDRALSPGTVKGEVARLAGGKPVELVYDAIALADTQQLAYEILAPGGTLVLSLPDEIPAEKKTDGSKKIVFIHGAAFPPEHRQAGAEIFRRLTEWLERGIVVPNKVEVLPNGLAGIPEGLERLKNNKVSGKKLIARPQETP
ncbi:GroES-like protein [Trametes elegans]|nr:GroES-like protein [Trametes elegans]